MKRVLTLAAVAACLLSLPVRAEYPIGMTISTNSVIVLPRRPIGGAQTWTNGIPLSQGALVENDRQFYMAEATIATSTNEPTHLSGVENNLRYVRPHKRVFFVFQNLSTNDVYLGFNHTAREDAGTRLRANESLTLSLVQDAVHAVADGTGTLVTANEILEK